MVRLLNEIAAAGAESMMQARPRLVAVDPPSEGGRRWAVMTLYVAVFTLFGGVIWYAYQETMGGAGDPPLIRAEAAPYKRAPDTPGGVDIENENSTLASRAFGTGREPPGMERILPRETPLPRKIEELGPPPTATASAAPTTEPASVPGRPSELAGLATPRRAERGQAAEQLHATEPSRQVAAISPAPGLGREAEAAFAATQVEPAAGPATPSDATSTNTARPVPQVLAGLPPSLTEPPRALPADQSATAAPVVTAPSRSGGVEPLTTPPAGRAAAPALPAPTATAPTRTAAIDRPAAVPPAAARVPIVEPAAPPVSGISPQGQWALQFAALSSTEAVDRAWSQLRGKHPELIGQLDRRMSPVTTSTGVTLYRLQGAGFEDRNAAARACATLKDEGTDCLVVAAGR